MADQERVTTRLEVDVTDFKKGLADANRYIRMANSEFENATAGVGKWSDSADGLRAKLTQLNKTLEGQEAAAEVLRHEYERVCKEQGETSKGAQELAIKLNKQEAAAKKTRAQIDHYEGKLDDTRKTTDETEKATVDMSGAFGKAATAAGKLATGLAKIAGKSIVNGIKGLAAASGTLVTAFLATSETSKEWITEMGKLEAAFDSSGHSAKTATKTFDALYGVIGETDQAVEAAQQIALLAESEEDAAKWADLASGVVGKFGDALQPETFYEAANESYKLNEATGAYVQLLEGCGASVEEFNKGLQACNTEEEKQAYMLQYTEGLLGSAGAAYKEANAAVIESNKANAALQASLAGVGEAAMPVMSAIKLMGAAFLKDLLPNIKQLGEAFRLALDGSKDGAAKMGEAVAGLLQQIVQKIVQALPTVLTVGTSIVTSLVQSIISAAPALAAGVGQIAQAFIGAAPQLLAAGASMVTNLLQGLAGSMPSIIEQMGSLVGSIGTALQTHMPQILTAGGDVVYQLLSGIVNNIPAMAQGAVNAIGGFVQGLQDNLPIILGKGKELLGKLGEGIRKGLPGLVSQGLDILMNFATTLYDNFPTIIDTGFDLLSNLVQGILDALPALISKGPEIISKFANIINDNFPKILKKGVELIGQIIKGLLQAIPTLVANIPKIITAIVDVWEAFNWLQLGKKAITWLKDGVLKMVGAVKSAGKNVMSSITNVIKELPGKLLEFGKSAISNLGNALSNGVSTVKSGAAKIFDGILGYFKDLPSKLLSVGKDLVKGLWNGISDMTGWIVGKIQGFGESVLGGIKSFFGISSPSKVMAKEVGKWLPAGMADGIAKNTKAATKAMTNMAKDAVGAANAQISGSGINMPGVNAGSTGAAGHPGSKTFVFNQYNNSPKALSRLDIYRQTKNQLIFATQS